MANAEAAARFAELPVPTTHEEPWRFTDLRGFDPSSYPVPTEAAGSAAASVLPELEVTASAEVSESGITIHADGLPAGVRFEVQIGRAHV